MKRLFVCMVLVLGVTLINSAAKAQPHAVGGVGQAAAAATMMSRYITHQTGVQRGLVQGATLRMIRLNPAVRFNPYLKATTSQTAAALTHGATAHHHSVRGSLNYGMGNISMGELRGNLAAHHTGVAQGHSAHGVTDALVNPTPIPTPLVPGGTLR